MKKIYFSLLLLVPFTIFCQEFIQEKQKTTIEKDFQDRLIENQEEVDITRTLSEADEDDFYEDMLDKMIEMGAVDEEVEMKPMPWWKVWLLRVGSSLFAKYDVCKKFVSNRYNDAKYIVAVAWAKVSGKKTPERKTKNKKQEDKKTEYEKRA